MFSLSALFCSIFLSPCISILPHIYITSRTAWTLWQPLFLLCFPERVKAHVLHLSQTCRKKLQGYNLLILAFSSQRMILPSNHCLRTHSLFSHRNEKQPRHTCAGLMWQTVVAPLRIHNVSSGVCFVSLLWFRQSFNWSISEMQRVGITQVLWCIQP